MNRAKESVRWAFRQAGAVIDVAQRAYEGLGVVIFQPIRVILGEFEKLALGVLDVVDKAATDLWKIVRGRS